MKRKLLALLAGLPWLSACASTIKDWAVVPGATAPFYRGQPTAVETRTVSTMSGSRKEIRYRAGYRTLDRDSDDGTREVAYRMVYRAIEFGLVPGKLLISAQGKKYSFLETIDNKRFFLASIKPSILLLVPWQFKMDDMYKGADGKLYLHARSLEEQLLAIQEQQDGIGFSYVVEGIAAANSAGGMWKTNVELSPIFPDVQGIQAISDRWEGVRSLAEMEADKSIPFKTEPDPGRPGFRRLVLR